MSEFILPGALLQIGVFWDVMQKWRHYDPFNHREPVTQWRRVTHQMSVTFHLTPRNKHAMEGIFCLPVRLVWCLWNWLVLLWSQTILILRQLGEWYVLLGASLQDTIHWNQVDQLQRWFCESTLSHLSSPGRVSHCAQPGGNVTGTKIIKG